MSRKRLCQEVSRLELGAIHRIPLSLAVQRSLRLEKDWAAYVVDLTEELHSPHSDPSEPGSDSGDCLSLPVLGKFTSLQLSAVTEFMLSALQKTQKAFLSLPSGTVSLLRQPISQVTTASICSVVLIFRCVADSPAKATLCVCSSGISHQLKLVYKSQMWMLQAIVAGSKQGLQALMRPCGVKVSSELSVCAWQFHCIYLCMRNAMR